MYVGFLEWIKQMIYLLIFLTILLQILPGGNYGKYVKFFAGLIFVTTIIGPAVSFLSGQNFEQLVEEQIIEAENDWEKEQGEGGSTMLSNEKMEKPDFQQMEKTQMEILTQYAEDNLRQSTEKKP